MYSSFFYTHILSKFNSFLGHGLWVRGWSFDAVYFINNYLLSVAWDLGFSWRVDGFLCVWEVAL